MMLAHCWILVHMSASGYMYSKYKIKNVTMIEKTFFELRVVSIDTECDFVSMMFLKYKDL
jgi:hypothetical protein